MDERLREILGDEDAWVVGGAIRDELLRQPVLDVDVACSDPREAAGRFARRFGGVVFPLSERHGAWRVVDGGIDETVDFTPVGEGIDDDLATRDFTFNAIAVNVRTGEPYDPHDGRVDLEAGVIKAVSGSVFLDDPLRLLRAVRFEDELGFRMDERTEALLRESVGLVTHPAGERVLAELERLSPTGFRRLDDVGLLATLGGALSDRLDALDDPDFRLVAVFGESLRGFRSPTSSAATRRRFDALGGRRIPPRERSTASGGRPSRGRSTRSRSSARRS